MTIQSIIQNLKKGQISKDEAFLQIKVAKDKADHTMVSQQLSVQDVLSQLLFINPVKIKLSDSLVDLGIDSIIIQELLIKIQETFGVKLAIEEFISNIATIEDLDKAINKQKQSKPTAIDYQLSDPQLIYLQSLFADFKKKTQHSYLKATQARQYFADQRLNLFFDQTFKSIAYPIFFKHAEGAKIIDIDNNEYLDIAGDFGVNLFGHQNEKLSASVIKQVEQAGCVLSMSSEITVEVSALFCELTKHDRVAFCQSGTEAVMVAMRMARAYTGRKKIVIFKGSYHGHFDGVLAHSRPDETNARPRYPGVIDSFLDDIICLEYGDKSALKYISDNIETLAGVLVEPVQSRFPEFNPKEYLIKLKNITEKHDTVLILDEMITGFRMHSGGIQGLFNLKADIAIYGKIACGGFTGGMIAGCADLMSLIDGGEWGYDDQSTPANKTTFMAGTHTHNPLKMAATLSVLKQIKSVGESFYICLNQRTKNLCESLNDIMSRRQVPIKVIYFGSLFRFKFLNEDNGPIRLTQPYEKTLFGKLLQFHGVNYLHQGNCFLTAAHTDTDLEQLVSTVDRVLAILIHHKFIAGQNDYLPANSVKNHVLSYEQQALWINTKFNNNYSMDSIPICLSVETINEEVLHKALKLVIQNHPMLRSTVDDSEVQLKQIIREFLPYEYNNDSHAYSTKETLFSSLIEYATNPVDLVNGPTIKVRLCFFKRQYYLLFVLHHFFVDGFSANIFIKQLTGTYHRLLTGDDVELQSEKATYTDYIDSQQIIDSTFRNEALNYWKNTLQKVDSPPRLPYDFKSDKPIKVDFTAFYMPIEISEKIYKYCKQNQMSLFNFVLSAFGLYISRLIGSEDFVIAIPTNPDDRFMKYNNTVGHFVNQLPIAFHAGKKMTLNDWFKDIKSQIIHCLKYQNLPFTILVDELRLSGKMHKILRLAFNHDIPIELPDTFYEIPLFNHTSNTDLGCIIQESNQSIKLIFSFNSCLFETKTIERLLTEFVQLMNTICGDDPMKLWTDDLVKKKKDSCSSIYENFHQTVMSNRSYAAIESESRDYTYAELLSDIDAFSKKLEEALVEKKHKPIVGLCFERSYEYVVTFMACLKLGVVFLPIEPSWPEKRKQEIVANSCCDFIIYSQQRECSLHTIDIPKVVFGQKSFVFDHVTSQHHELFTDVAGILYTSGSTGKPKGVMIHEAGLLNTIKYTIDHLQIKPRSKLLQFASIAFDASIWEILTALLSGAQLSIPKPDQIIPGKTLHDTLAHLSINVALLPPCVLQATPNNELPNFHTLVAGGENLTSGAVKKWSVPYRKIFNAYGPTEGSILCMLSEPLQNDEDIVLGNPVEHMNIKLFANGVVSNEIGEIYICGIGVSLGYLNAPGLTKQRFATIDGQRYFKTGDLAEYTKNGLKYLGRLDRCVKIRGNRVDLTEVETALSKLNQVEQGFVFYEASPQGTNELYAAVLVDTPVEMSEFVKKKKLQLAEYLPTYAIPNQIFIIDSLSFTSNGKIDYSKIKKKCFTENASNNQQTQQYGIQEIKQLWASTINISPEIILDESNFFDLGGNSLTAVYIVDQVIKKIPGTSMSVPEFFDIETFSLFTEILGLKERKVKVNTSPLLIYEPVQTDYI